MKFSNELNLYKSLFFTAFFLTCFSSFGQNHYINIEWGNNSGLIGSYHKTTSILDNDNNLIVASNLINSSGNSDVLVTKYSPEGIVLWQNQFNSSLSGEDYAVQLTTNNLNEIYIAAVFNMGNNSDFGVIKYSANGSLVFSNSWNNQNTNGMDIPTDIDIDDSNNVYLVGSTQTSNTLSDYSIIKFDTTGAFLWSSTYDYTNLHDAATSLIVKNNYLIVTGASASALNNWDFATLEVNTSNGVITNTNRTNFPGFGFDKAISLTIDSGQNIYITGAVESNNNMNIQTIKINSNFNIEWIKYFDSGAEDIAKDILIDSNGDILVAGISQNQLGGKDYLLLKYDQNGNEIWFRRTGSEENLYISSLEKMTISLNSDVLLSGSINKLGSTEFLTVCYSQAGDLKFAERYDAGSQFNEANSIAIAGNSFYVSGVTVVNGDTLSTTLKYTVNEKQSNIVTDENNISYNSNELIIRFDKSSINLNTINDKHFVSGALSEFVNANTINQLNQKTGFDWTKLETYKIFRNLTTADSISISRIGDTVKIDDFWAAISVFIPNGFDEQTIADSIATLYPIVQYAERNYSYQLNSTPNDALYLQQMSGLYDNSHGMNVENAWDHQVGQTYVKIGVFDSGVNWRHEDFGFGTPYGSKIMGGWDYSTSISPFLQTTPDPIGHGTAVAGLIGALRNNQIGISGVAGGDMQNNNPGCLLYTFKINSGGSFGINTDFAAAAILEGAANNPVTGYGYALNLQNHSWSGNQSSNLIKDAVEFCFINNCLFVASSGNNNTDINFYPATYNDNWVMKVGANDASGNRASFSNYGANLDVIAPGINDMYICLRNSSNSGYSDVFDFLDINGNPSLINGTSFAAPNASGVAGLLLSEHNINNGYPNNLAPEDVEYFLQSFAKDVQANGYDLFTGSGRVDANASIEKLMLPQYFVKHSGGSNSTTSFPTNLMQVNLIDNINGVAAGNYFAKRYQVTNTFIEILQPSQTVLSIWPRLSSSSGFSAANPISGDTYFSIAQTTNQNVVSVTTTTFCWYVQNSTNGQVINKWIPDNPNALKTSYSLYIKDNSTSGIAEFENKNDLKIFPNPSNSYINFEFEEKDDSNSNIEIYDAIGNLIVNQKIEFQGIGKRLITINLSNLSDGLYFCKLNSNGNIQTKEFVKN